MTMTANAVRKPNRTRKPLTDAEKASRNEAIQEIHAELERKFAELTTSEDWVRALDYAAKFYRYSFGNTLWLYSQAMAREIDLTRVASFGAWKDLNRSVKRGETALRVLAPCRYKVTDPKTGEDRWIVKGFKPVPVFDASQTDGEPLPDAEILPSLLTDGGADALQDQVVAMVAEQGFTFELEAIPGSANGYTDHAAKRVIVRNDVELAQRIKTSIHELAHVLLHAPGQIDYHANRSRCEVEAESVAYVVMTRLGIVADSYSLPYVAGWSGGDVKIVRATAETVIKTARIIIDAIESV